MDRSSGTDRLLPPATHRGFSVGGFYFPTYVTLVNRSGQHLCLNARCHRKGKAPRPVDARKRAPIHFWAPEKLGWWIAVLFMIGSLCFAVGAWAAAFPQWIPRALHSVPLQNGIFFIGSIFFTSAATLQFVEARQALHRTELRLENGDGTTRLPERFAHLGVSSAFAQWIGTLLFNVNTFDALYNADN